MNFRLLIIPIICLSCVLRSSDRYAHENDLYAKSEYAQAVKAYEEVFAIEAHNDSVDMFWGYPITRDQAYYNARVNCGLACWAIGNFQKGFKYFESRLAVKPTEEKLKKPLPIDIAEQALNGKRILVRSEYGLGDTCMFLSALTPFKTAGAHIILKAQPPLQSLLSRSNACVNEVITTQDSDPDFDFDIYLMSSYRYVSKLGRRPAASPDDIVNIGRYINPLVTRIAHWITYFNKKETMPITICWQASTNPLPGGRVLQRNIPVSVLARLSKIPQVQLYSLQGNGHRPVRKIELDILTAYNAQKTLDECDLLSEEFADDVIIQPTKEGNMPFEDTAALMVAVHQKGGFGVYCDTSTPNLSGALNLRTCLLLPLESCGRWGEAKPGACAVQSRWYENTKEFWQSKQEEWDDVVDNVKKYIEDTMIKR